MPYRNALRDNWNRFQQANDAEMRLAARQQMQQARPQGQYAGMSMADMYRVLQGEQPQEYTPEPVVQVVAPPPPQPEQADPGYKGYTDTDDPEVIRRRRLLREAEGRGY